ncbi:hypothetical protein ACRAKI_00605 [Saccharothrix isguenensis]
MGLGTSGRGATAALAPALDDRGYRNRLLQQACDGPGLPADPTGRV